MAQRAEAFVAAIRTGYSEVAVWSGGSQAADLDVWFLHAFADTHEVFGHAFTTPLLGERPERRSTNALGPRAVRARAPDTRLGFPAVEMSDRLLLGCGERG